MDGGLKEYNRIMTSFAVHTALIGSIQMGKRWLQTQPGDGDIVESGNQANDENGH